MFSWVKKQSKGRYRIMIEESRQNEIESQVDTLVQKYGLSTPGFDLAQFLSEHEGFVLGERVMEDDTTGILLVNKTQKLPKFYTNQLIATNANLRYAPDYKERRRFIVAHEYAHYRLHMEGGAIFAHRDYAHKDDPMEAEADFFARCLLMPRSQVNTVLKTLPENSSLEEKVDLISRTFRVTKKKAAQRLQNDLEVA